MLIEGEEQNVDDTATDDTSTETDDKSPPTVAVDGEGDTKTSKKADDTKTKDAAEEKGGEKDKADASDKDGAPPKTLLADAEGEELVFKAPDGMTMADDAEEQIGDFRNYIVENDLRLTPDQFQKIIEYEHGRGAKATEKAVTDFHKRVTEWGKQTEKDEELGGDNLTDTKAHANAAMKKFGSEKLRNMFRAFDPEKNPEGLGLGNHPEILRVFSRIGKALSEDSFIADEGGEPVEGEDALRRMYPTMFPEKGKAA